MKKPLFNKICIVGVGLIGGSLGLAIKKRKLARWVVGVTRRKETIQKAFGMGALDIATLDLKEGVKDADLVILCAPISTMRSARKSRPVVSRSNTTTGAPARATPSPGTKRLSRRNVSAEDSAPAGPSAAAGNSTSWNIE